MRRKLLNIPLKTNWHCRYIDLTADLSLPAMRGVPITLSSWAFDSQYLEGCAALLQHPFTLTPIDECVRYWLSIDIAPQDTLIYVNNKQVAQYHVADDSPPFELDITNFVALGENSLTFRVESDKAGQFKGVRLAAYPCE